MNRPRFLQGAGIAALLAIAAAVLMFGFGRTAGLGTAVRLTVPLLSLGYIFYLLRASGERIGKVTVVLGWVVTAVAAWWAGLPPAQYVLAHSALIWLVRSLYFHDGVLAAAADLGLSLFAVAALGFALDRTGSVLLAAWCFFLAQALFTAIPALHRKAGRKTAHIDNSAFEQARRQADAALRQLAGR